MSKIKVWAVTHLQDAKLVVRTQEFFCKGAKGVLIPQPEGDLAKFCVSHPSFTLVKLTSAEAEELGLTTKAVQPGAALPSKPIKPPEIKKSEDSDVPDPASMTWPELRAYARSLGIKAKKKPAILQALADL